MELGILIGDRIKAERINKKMTQEDLAIATGLSVSSIGNYESGKRELRVDKLMLFAKALGVSAEYLVNGEGPKIQNREKVVEIPLLSMAVVASCGVGNGLIGVDMENTETILKPKEFIGTFDNERMPFAIRTDGDSMLGAGLKEGSIAIINPAEEIFNGDAALVCFGDNWFIKWVIYNPDGSVELRPSNNDYKSITIEKEYATDPSWFRIIGKVVWIDKGCAPSRAF